MDKERITTRGVEGICEKSGNMLEQGVCVGVDDAMIEEDGKLGAKVMSGSVLSR